MAKAFIPPKQPSPSQDPNAAIEAKIVLLGDTGVGKTSIALRFTQDTFQTRTTPTIGASFLMKNLVIDEKKIKLQIWDTAGQERFKSLAPMYYRGASAALLIYDVTSPSSFNKVKDWVNELRINVPEDIIMVIVGNKIDKLSDRVKNRTLKPEVGGQDYARSVGASFIETSAKTKEGIEEVFRDIANRLIQNWIQSFNRAKPPEIHYTHGPNVTLTTDHSPKEINDSCCQD